MPNRRFVIIHETPAEVKSVVEPLRHRLAELTLSHESLSYPVHITLRTGMLIPDESVDDALDRFMAHCSDLRRFSVTTDGYWFQNYEQDETQKYLVGLKIGLDDNLWRLHRSLLDFSEFQKGLQQPFCPHISLVYHDLTQNWYERLKIEPALLDSDVATKMSWDLDNVGVWEFDSHKWVCRRAMELKKDE